MASVGFELGSFNFTSCTCLLEQGIVSDPVGREGPWKVSEQESDNLPIGTFSPASGKDRLNLG